MKILLVNDSAAPVGGAEIMTLTLRDGLRARGHEVRLLASGADGGEADFRCPSARGRLQVALQTANPGAALALRRALRTFRPDVVHVRMFLTQLSPLILPALRRVPALYHATMYESVCPTGLKLLPDGADCRQPAGAACLRSGCVGPLAWPPLMVKLALWRRWRNVFDLVVANSEATRRRLLEDGIGPVEVVWNGVPARPARPPLVGPPLVGYAGRLAREKGVDVLLRAFAAADVPGSRLILGGDGPERPALEALAGSLGLAGRVEFAGHLPRPELERRLEPAWAQAVPSRWGEPFGIVAAEAMMRGTAVVASDSGGLAEVVVDGVTGFRVPPGDVDALAAALRRLLSDPALAERLGAAGRDLALRQFSATTFVDRFEAIYRGLAGRPSPAGGPHRFSSRPLRGAAMQTAAIHPDREPESAPASDPAEGPALSVVVVTPDRFETIRRTVRHLRMQASRGRIELVMVAPTVDALDDASPGELEGFQRVVRVPADGPIRCVERAAVPGIRAATAPVLALVEDHAFPAPGWAEALLEAHRGPWAAVGSAMINANPRSGLSWTNLLIAYGRWVEPERGGPIDALPGHNISYKRPALMAFDARLESMLGRESTLHDELKAGGGQLYLEPAAGIAHLNPSLLWSTATLRFQAGWLYGALRARREGWPAWKRLVYIAGAPLIPLVRLRRLLRELFPTPARRDLLPRVLPALLYGLALDGAGQALGYAIGPGGTRDRLSAFEIDRIRHLSRRDRRDLAASDPPAEAAAAPGPLEGAAR